MDNINSTFENIKANLKYIINSDDSFEIIINKIIEKLKETGINISNIGYEIIDFKENFSNINFKIQIDSDNESKIENVYLIIPNNEFNKNVLNNYKTAIEIYLINSLELDINKCFVNSESVSFSSSEEKITKRQLEYLKDKMENPEIESLVLKSLSELGIDKIENLSKKNASSILDKIQNFSKKTKKRYQ